MKFSAASVLLTLALLCPWADAAKKPAKRETPAENKLPLLPSMPVLQEIAPPYDHMVWFEPSEGIEGRLKVSKLVVSERRKIGQQWTIAVTGFQKPDPTNPNAPKPPELKRLTFFFAGGQIAKEKEKGKNGKVTETLKHGQLVEVEMQYAQDGWMEAEYDACFGEKRRLLEGAYGTGQQIARIATETPDGKATQALVGYKWVKKTTMLELIYFSLSATEGDQHFHTLSIHYKRT